MVTDQLWFVSRQRRRGMSVSALRQLLPLWRFMKRSVKNKLVSLNELEEVAANTLTSEEAMYAAPGVVQQSVPCPRCKKRQYSGLKFEMKDGSVRSVGSGDDVSIGFVLAIRDSETSKLCDTTTMRIAFTRTDEGHNETSIILGLKPGENLPGHSPTRIVELNDEHEAKRGGGLKQIEEGDR